MIYYLLIPLAFVLGSVPFGVLIARWVKGIDLREFGSGNIGTANAFRALGVFWGALVFLGDLGKGFLGAYLGNFFSQDKALMVVICGLFAILGHNYSLFLKFKGGKGIATSLGVLVFLDWRIAGLGFLVWGFLVGITRISAVGSLMAALAVPFLMLFFHCPPEYIGFGFIACGVAVIRHKENLKRLLNKEELKLSENKGAKKDE